MRVVLCRDGADTTLQQWGFHYEVKLLGALRQLCGINVKTLWQRLGRFSSPFPRWFRLRTQTHPQNQGKISQLWLSLLPLDVSPGVTRDCDHLMAEMEGTCFFSSSSQRPTPLIPEIITAGANWDAGWQPWQGEKRKQPDTL